MKWLFHRKKPNPKGKIKTLNAKIKRKKENPKFKISKKSGGKGKTTIPILVINLKNAIFKIWKEKEGRKRINQKNGKRRKRRTKTFKAQKLVIYDSQKPYHCRMENIHIHAPI